MKLRFLSDRAPAGFYRTALSLAIPIAFQNLLTSCATLIDTAMVVGLGNAATSAMGIAARFSFLLNVVCFGFASGCAALLSQYWGANDRENIRRSLGFALTVSMTFALLYTIVMACFPTALMRIFTDVPETITLGASYLRTFSLAVPFLVLSQILCAALRAVECVKIPLYSAAVSVCVNTFLNYCYINGHFGCPALGLRGAAIGSVAGCVVQAIILVLAVLFCNTPFRGKIRDGFRFTKDFCKRYFQTAFPVLLNESLWALGSNVYVMVLARQGTENHSGYTLYENIQQIFFVFFVGICGACSVMVGKRVGAGEQEEAYQTAKRFAVMTPVTGLLLGTLLILLRNPILSLFPVETEGARMVASACLFVLRLLDRDADDSVYDDLRDLSCRRRYQNGVFFGHLLYVSDCHSRGTPDRLCNQTCAFCGAGGGDVYCGGSAEGHSVCIAFSFPQMDETDHKCGRKAGSGDGNSAEIIKSWQ